MLIEIKSKVSMPQGVKIYQGDNNVDDILVTVDRFYGDYDLINFNAYLKIKYVDDTCNQILLKTIIEESTRLVLEAKIDNNLTRVAGQIVCQPFFSNEDGSLCFNTSTFELEIEPSIEAYKTIKQDMLPGTLELLESELKMARQELEDTVNSFDLGEILEENVNKTIDKIVHNSMLKFFVVYPNGVKEPRCLITKQLENFSSVQTMIYPDASGAFTNFATRRAYYGTVIVWELWKEDQIITKSYLDQKIEELKASLA